MANEINLTAIAVAVSIIAALGYAAAANEIVALGILGDFLGPTQVVLSLAVVGVGSVLALIYRLIQE